MDDTIAIAIFAVGIAITFAFARHLVMTHKANVELAKLKDEELKKEREARRASMLKVAASNPGIKKESLSDLAYMKERKLITPAQHTAAVREKRNETSVSTTSDSNLLSDLADVAMIVNTIHHWNGTPHMSNTNNPIDFPKEERSVGVTTKESSWGFDDSDSRKSISSSMDTSPSYSSSSSSSSDSWSSSDSSSSSVSSDW